MKCSVCSKNIESESPEILVMGGYATPRYLCDGCAMDFDLITHGKVAKEISEAMERISENLSNSDPDKVTFETAVGILSSARERAIAIKEGRYDFSNDENEESDEDVPEEIPEELLETEEDIELDRQDEEKNKKFDKVYNIILGIIIAVMAGFIIWRMFDTFLF